jgi:hypothetical protein
MKGKRKYVGIVEEIEALGARRLQVNGTLDRGDFFSGAMKALMLTLGWTMGEMPSRWTMGMMAGDFDPVASQFIRLTGIEPPKDGDWRMRYKSALETARERDQRVADLEDALGQALDVIEVLQGEGDDDETYQTLRSVLEGKEEA